MQHFSKPSRAVALIAVVSVAVVTGACSDSLGSRSAPATLSFAVKPATAASVAQQGTIAQIVVTAGTHTLDLQAADVSFSRLMFQGVSAVSDTASAGDDDDDSAEGADDEQGEHEDEINFRVGPATVSLPLEGGVITPFDGALPLGTYYRLKMKADSARLRGTFDGQAFDVTVPVMAMFRLSFSPPLQVTGTDPLNVTVNIDVTPWFKDANGNVIDPRQLATDETMRQEFINRVRASFRAFEDHDRDADEHDDNDHDGGDGR